MDVVDQVNGTGGDMEQNGDIIDMNRPVTVLERDTVYQGAVFSVEDMRLALHARDGGDIVVRRQVMRHAPVRGHARARHGERPVPDGA